MKRLNLQPRPSLLVLALLASPMVLHAQDTSPNTGMYMGISAGESKAHIDNVRITQGLLGAGLTTDSLTEDRKDTGYKAFIGFPMNPFWAIETGYFDLGRFGFTANTTPAGSLTGSARIKGLNLDLVGTLPITDQWSLLGRVGAAYAQTTDTFSGTGAVSVLDPSPRKRETNYKYGFGTQYAFTPALTLRLEAERYRINDAVGNRGDVDLVSLGLVYRFGGSSKPAAPTQAVSTYTPYVAPAPVVVAAAPVAAPAPPPAPAPAPKPWVKVKLEADSLFGFDQDSLQADGKQVLDKLLMELQSVNVDTILVTGHTDRLGSKAYNDKLSTRRAQAVQKYLIDVGGISASKITATGLGNSQPQTQPNECKGTKATQALITCLRVDRRVEVDVNGAQQQR